ncbi:DUF308 domain-containing protein [Candidatus Saccharibacteria bacterium]|nr:DUF308 domain-containing protein [Candidatus Saccharibacteria bacterium]
MSLHNTRAGVVCIVAQQKSKRRITLKYFGGSMDSISTVHSHSHWPYIVEGILLILFGLVAIVWPGMTAVTFASIFGLYALIAGVVGVVSGIVHLNAGWSSIGEIVLGALFIAAGSYILDHPGTTAVTLVLFVGFTFIFRGVFDVVAAIGSNSNHKALSIVSGVLALLVGLVLLRYPVGAGVAYVWVIGIYALVSGPIVLAVGLGAGDPAIAAK